MRSVPIVIGDEFAADRRQVVLVENDQVILWGRRGELWLAVVQAAFGNFDEALRPLPRYDPGWQKLETVVYRLFAMRIFLDAGDLQSAVREAQRLPVGADSVLPVNKLLLFDGALESFLKAGRIEAAEHLVDRPGRTNSWVSIQRLGGWRDGWHWYAVSSRRPANALIPQPTSCKTSATGWRRRGPGVSSPR